MYSPSIAIAMPGIILPLANGAAAAIPRVVLEMQFNTWDSVQGYEALIMKSPRGWRYPRQLMLGFTKIEFRPKNCDQVEGFKAVFPPSASAFFTL